MSKAFSKKKYNCQTGITDVKEQIWLANLKCLETSNLSLMTLLASCGTNTTFNSIPLPKKLCCTSSQLSWQKRNAVVPLASHDADPNGITWPKKSWYISFLSSWPYKWYGTIDETFVMYHWHEHQWHYMPKKYVVHCFVVWALCLMTMPLASHDADASANSVKWLNKSCCISFWSSWTNKCSGAIDDAISVKWCKQWSLLMRKVMLQLFSFLLT